MALEKILTTPRHRRQRGGQGGALGEAFLTLRKGGREKAIFGGKGSKSRGFIGPKATPGRAEQYAKATFEK
jgi:hypothetical protein